jgi:DNA-binding HxlR family transcriptional regulator
MRTYGDRCGIARALDVVGERWALLVVRELLLGPKRFTDLRAGLPQIGPDVLSQRLRELEGSGIVTKRKLPPPAPAQLYELTERGQALETVVLELGRWGSQAPVPAEDAPLGADAAMLALKTMFRPEAAADIRASYEFRFGEQRFHARVREGTLTIERGSAEQPDAVIDTEPGLLAAMLWHGHEPADPNVVRLRALFPLSRSPSRS